jgi:hypothetical protein
MMHDDSSQVVDIAVQVATGRGRRFATRPPSLRVAGFGQNIRGHVQTGHGEIYHGVHFGPRGVGVCPSEPLQMKTQHLVGIGGFVFSIFKHHENDLPIESSNHLSGCLNKIIFGALSKSLML